jgi:hypothetical protein
MVLALEEAATSAYSRLHLSMLEGLGDSSATSCTFLPGTVEDLVLESTG